MSRHAAVPARPVTQHAAELRIAFDAAFAAPIRTGTERPADFLAVRVAGDPYALAVAEVAGVFTDRPVTPLPGPEPALLGLAGLRGVVVPVYDLAALLGLAPVTGGEPPRWLALGAGRARVGFAFEAFDRHLRLAGATTAVTGAEPGGYVSGFAATGGAHGADAALPVLSLPALVEAIKARTAPGAAERER